MTCSHDLRVRLALSSDREFFFEVRRAALRAYVEQTSGWDDAEQRITADKEFANLPCAVVEESGRPIGYTCVIHQSEYDFIEEIALLPEAQGRGIGTHLLQGILRAAQRRGVPVRLSVFVNNPARALYTRLGFEVVRIEDPRMSMQWTPGNA
ncbi:acetyltransferase [Frankia sp. CcI6]|uniref:GNAT family N-acetyltransferase n=1 Tax=Frankia TaxID=1854 RepID=UPI0003CFC6BB|nr:MULTISPECIES: GNAT family N-acetyltransferase [Frankia]ETA01234.1 acetyltransferase [Frankia sp. CcI6]KFB04679.1 acetyltransferase [Frankia sp. Allo2]OAA22581.1 acetyltransferase [Frankia casuarinae]OHV52802.1 GNAT family N-acetyltransferase [Frankia sp. CgIS1]